MHAESDSVFGMRAGGIGPTHDDVTLKAVASAFGTIIEEDANMMALLPALCKVEEGQELSEAQRRFAQLPRVRAKTLKLKVLKLKTLKQKNFKL